jgi:hypothetical protein
MLLTLATRGSAAWRRRRLYSERLGSRRNFDFPIEAAACLQVGDSFCFFAGGVWSAIFAMFVAFLSRVKAVAGRKAKVETEGVIQAEVQSPVCGNSQVSIFFVPGKKSHVGHRSAKEKFFVSFNLEAPTRRSTPTTPTNGRLSCLASHLRP